jgi:predicted RNA-binding protein with PUA-like domain
LIYHSNSEPNGIAGEGIIVKEGYPDPFAFDSSSKYFDPKSKLEKPTWYCVNVKLTKKYKRLIPLVELKNHEKLSGMEVCKKGNRLSIQTVKPEEYEIIQSLI